MEAPPPPYCYYPDPYDAHTLAPGFSRGSSFAYPHQDYRYLLDRGELASRASGLVDAPFDATGLGFAGDPSPSTPFFPAPEDISAYQQQTWDWIGVAAPARIVAPAPMYPSCAEEPYFGIKEAARQPSVLRSPPAQLPTPAAMAILLHPHGRSEPEPSPSGYDIAPGSAIVVPPASSSAAAVSPRPEEPAVTTLDAQSREKKHACTMCHKRFDRPSTLRKHLLVHTGEKAFVCDTCGRRFGVASNLNRHVKRCILKPVNTPSPNSHSGSPSAACEPSASPALIASVSSPMSAHDSSRSKSGRRGRTTTSPIRGSPTSSTTHAHASAHAPSSPASNSKAKPAAPKRRRRAPSPSQWVPATLQNFNLLSEDSYRGVTAVPLPPVRRNPPREERDSWDENVGHSPYHPGGWSGVLPGPGLGHGLGLGGKDVRNLNLGGRGGHMLGRVLVF